MSEQLYNITQSLAEKAYEVPIMLWTVFNNMWEVLLKYVDASQTNMMVSIAIGILTSALVLYYVWFKVNKGRQGRQKQNESNRYRFRKRDKVLFYGRKMIRRVKSLTKPDSATSSRRFSLAPRGSKKQLEVLKIAKKLLRIKKENEPRLNPKEPPAAFFEADWKDDRSSDYKLPAEVMYMLKSVRVLGHFEKPIFLELCRFMESRFVPAGTHLFKIGDIDDSIFVVQSGRVCVYIRDKGKDVIVKQVSAGENIHSLLSILDVLTGHPAPFKTVSAVADMDSTVLRLPCKAFQIVLDRFPESMVRVVQIIMVRLQRVTFTALHNYLGLSYELMNPQLVNSDKGLSVHSIGFSSHGSVIKLNNSDNNSTTNLKGTDQQQDGASNSEKQETSPARSSMDSYITNIAVAHSCAVDIKQPHKSTTGSPVPRNRDSTKLQKVQNSKPSDFDMAMSRAIPEENDDPIICGTPPPKSNTEDVFFPPGSSNAHLSAGPSQISAPAKVAGTKKATIKAPYVPHLDILMMPESLVSDQELLNIAMTDIAKLFGLSDASLLERKCHLRNLKNGTKIIKQGDHDSSLYFLVCGKLNVSQAQIGLGSEQASLFMVQPGELVGALAVLTGEPSFFKVKARSDSVVAVITKADFYNIMKEEPRVVLNVGHSVVKRMSPFVRQIDFALDWMYLEAGKSLFRQGDLSENVFIVLNGRLRSVVTQGNGKKALAAEYGRGELVGIVEVLTQNERATTMMAIRDSELAILPESLLNLIKRTYPQVVARLIHLLGHRILGSLKKGPTTAICDNPSKEPSSAVANLNTVAILPVSEDVPLYNFTLELQHNLNAIGQTLRLTSEIIQTRLGPTALDSVNEYRLSSWLGQQEDIHRMVLYQCDFQVTPWTQRCIRQADCLLIVGLGDGDPRVGKIEKEIEQFAARAQKELILLHRDTEDNHPKNTVEWLNARGWCSSHHHLKCPKRVFSKKSKSKMMQIYRNLFETEPDRLSDFSRLARFLTGTAIGLVLGGGGARGIAHVGIVRALIESGIPVDFVGGTSIGSFVGALWAEERNIVTFTQKAREWAMNMKSTWKKVLDLTYPVTAMFKGAEFNRSIKDVFEDRQIEDLWIPYFCISTDITASKMRVHTSGSLWRYVRASMSLSGYLPPLCDPVDGHMLLDGGYVNNLPADIMKSFGAQTIFAVDVGSQDECNFTNYGDELSGWWLFWRRWNPCAEAIRIPNLGEIQSRLAYVSCVKQLEQVKDSGEYEYIRPPIDKFTTLQFGAFDEIFDVGYSHGKAIFSAWVKKGLVKELFMEKKDDSENFAQMRMRSQSTMVTADSHFTDLAELVSRIDKPRYPFTDLNDELDMYEDDSDTNMSVTSEPGVSSIVPSSLQYRHKAKSAGGSPIDSDVEEFEMPPESSREVSTDHSDHSDL